MKAPLPKNEAKRLKVLWQYDLLDTVPEEVFDELTDLAAHICEAPIALISLVDENRQWFKSRIGTSIKETSRDVSLIEVPTRDLNHCRFSSTREMSATGASQMCAARSVR